VEISPLAGRPAQPIMVVNAPRLVTVYYSNLPDAALAIQPVAFGTSGHRVSAFENSSNDWHVLAISQAICDDHGQQCIDSPLCLGIDTHARSELAYSRAIEVLADKDAESFRGADHLWPMGTRTCDLDLGVAWCLTQSGRY